MSDERTPALIANRDIAAIRGLVPTLIERRHNAGPALERIIASWDGLGADFVVIQRTELVRHLVEPGAADSTRRRRRWPWRRAA